MFEASSSSFMIEGSFLRSSTTVLRKTSAILLQIVMVSPGNHLVKNHESQSRTNESQFQKKRESEIENAGPGPSCNQTFNLKTDSKTLYYSILILKYSPSIIKAQQRPKEICIVKQRP